MQREADRVERAGVGERREQRIEDRRVGLGGNQPARLGGGGERRHRLDADPRRGVEHAAE
jgi:hypothetical protein